MYKCVNKILPYININKMALKKSNTLKAIKTHKKTYSFIKRNITRKNVRQHEVKRVHKIMNVLLSVIKFYNTFSKKEIIALKYYKGYGSLFQTNLLTNNKKPRDIFFPFSLNEEESFRSDIFGSISINNEYPMLQSFDIKDIPNYIKNNYKLRIAILNDLDAIYNKPKCPLLTGNEILFRGMRMPDSFKKLKTGDTFTFKNFISTTFDRHIAEFFSDGESLFIFNNIINIPFLYMPGNKIYADNAKDYTKELGKLTPYSDYSEYTLPRNLEFKIYKIENGFTNILNTKNKTNTPNIYNLLNLLQKNKKIQNTDSPNSSKFSTSLNSSTSETSSEAPRASNIIENNIYKKIKIYYCEFIKWHPRELINYENIMNGANFILDKEALKTWQEWY